MEIRTKVFLKNRFKAYYIRNAVQAPPEVEKREFGVGTLADKIKTRHKSFRSERDMQNFLRREAPFYVSYSTAFYDFPQNPMAEKGWRGAELVFDLDVEMALLEAKKMEKVKKEAITLYDYLAGDFGIPEEEIKVNFSGSKGYHLHVLSDCVRGLGRDERREIVDYVAGKIDFKDYLRFTGTRSEEITGPKKGDRGWPGRIYSKLRDLISDATLESLQEIPGIGEKKAAVIMEKKERILSELDAGRYDAVPEIVSIERSSVGRSGDPNLKLAGRIESVKSPLIQNIVEYLAVHMEAEDTDKMVTIDTSRLIRLPGTLHGGSGLKAARVRSLEEFDPLVDAVAFGEAPVKVVLREKVDCFDLSGKRFGPFEPGTVELPEHAAVYLLLKDKGDVAE